MRYPQIDHHGAREGVTGSCHQLFMTASHSLLIDCGLFQGSDALIDGEAEQQRLAIDFDISTVQALVVTHVHIDHVGRIPYLLAAGFKGPILCSEPSARLLPIVLEDAFRLSFSRRADWVERYIRLIEARIIALSYDSWFTLEDNDELNSRIRLQRAGHILGSCYVEVDLEYMHGGAEPSDHQSSAAVDNVNAGSEEGAAQPGNLHRRIVFSGDLGAPYAPLLSRPQPPERADTLVLESTYGDRLHEDRRHRRERLQRVIERALEDRGTVLIPAFSIGRTQELLYELEDIIHQQLPDRPEPRVEYPSPAHADPVNWPELPVILDSPLAGRFTDVYRQMHSFWDEEARRRIAAGRDPFGFRQLVSVDEHDDHQRIVRHLAETARPAIVIAASGMCSGGRIVNYLKAMLGDARHNVVFVGYQAPGTPGHAIQTYGPSGGYVELEGERFPIRLGVDSLGGYSAHADQQDLVDFVTGMRQWPEQIRIVHGEKDARIALASVLRARYEERGREVRLDIGDRFI